MAAPVGVFLVVAACGPGAPKSPDPAKVTFIRDSLVNDSVARSINTESLARLYVALLDPRADTALEQELVCEQFRHSWRYGWTPAALAESRVQDSLRAIYKKRWDATNARGFRSGETIVGEEVCGIAGEQPAPDSIGNTSLDLPVNLRRE